jgi:essential nuclear protein 1
MLLLTFYKEVDPNDLDMFNKFMPHEEDCILGDTTTLDVLTIGPFAGLLRLVLGNLLENQIDPSSAGPTNLADLILEKIAEHEAKQAGEGPYGQYRGAGQTCSEKESCRP